MTEPQWQAFRRFRDDFRAQCAAWNDAYADELGPLQAAAAQKDTPPYPLETAVVYNRALDDVTAQSRITYIVIGDNPGKDEQRTHNNRYLVGQSGKIAQGFFARHPDFATDFRTNVIILNKTPVHTAKTAHLRAVARHGGERIRALFVESQLWMAQKTAALHRALYAAADGSPTAPAPELWLVGYTELRPHGLFERYRDTLKAAYTDDAPPDASAAPHCAAWNAVRVYRHFSMNQFLIELRTERATTAAEPAAEPIAQTLARIGVRHRQELFG